MKKINIFVGICSHFAGKERRNVIRNTWLKYLCPEQKIDCKFFIGGDSIPNDDRKDTIALGSNDSYEYLPRKCFDFYKWVYENYDFDYIFKCDDDTFLAIDRLVGLVDDKYDLIGDLSTVEPDRMAPSGGAGYFLSRNLVAALLEHGVPDTGCEDLVFGQLALCLGFKCKGDKRLCMHSGNPPLADNDMVSCHWCSIEQMEIYDKLYHSFPLLTLKAEHDYWKSDVDLYEGGILRKKDGGDIAVLENHGKGIFSINWLGWEKELIRKQPGNSYVGDHIKVTPKSNDNIEDFVPSTHNYLPSSPRTAICISSYKRFDHLERQIFSMLNQTYHNIHVFVAVKGVSEYFYKKVVLPLFRSSIDQGRLTIRHFPNKNQLSNFVDTIRGIDVSEFDLFFKIDDDDFYSPDYIADCCHFHQTIPGTWSSYLDDNGANLNESLGFPYIINNSYSGMFGFTMVFSRLAMEKMIECDRNPQAMHPISAKWDHCEGHHSYGFTEDHFYHNIIKELGGCNRASYLKDQQIDFHIMVNKVLPSMTRGKGLLLDDFKHLNAEINFDPDRWEHIMEVQHPCWEAIFRLFNKRGMRLDNNDSFEILEFDGKKLVVKWDSYGIEKFIKQNTGIFRLEN